ncbi:hypothetical protein [Paucihalobacter sp.]|uniref:hypothetical protein n=1 Tax=Paucihalobacter sp. TaxID=2850405 RepID=UPI003D161F3C
MKILKFFGVVILLLSLQACIVKSIQPFYVSEAVSFEKSLLGKFTDNKQGKWEIMSFKEAFEKDSSNPSKYSKDDLEALEKYKQAYVVNKVKKEKEAAFLVVPFKVYNETFLDFTPIAFDDSESNSLAMQHLLKTHSVAKMNKLENNAIQLQWLDEKPISELFNKSQLKLKHETVGVDETLVLTATSNELYQFLQKFVKSDIEDKWKDSETYNLTPLGN